MAESFVLKRQVNVIDCFFLIVGTIIASGIFISPKGVLANTGTVGWALVTWVISGIISGLGALCYAELGSSIAKSGGEYTYIKDFAGPLVAFFKVWTYILSRSATSAILAITAADSVISPVYMNCEGGIPFAISRLLACSILVAVTFANSFSVSLVTKFQLVFTIAKILGLGIIIISGIVVLIQGDTENFQNAFDTQEVTWGKFPLAILSGLYAFAGWQHVPNITEEIVNPSRNIPRAIIYSLFFITLVYVAANVAYFAVLSPSELLAADAVAVSHGMRVLGSWWVLMPVSVFVSCIGGLNGNIFMASRMFFVASRDGQFPLIFSMIHVDRQTPLPAASIIVRAYSGILSVMLLLCYEYPYPHLKRMQLCVMEAAKLPISSVMLASESVFQLINSQGVYTWLFIAVTVATVPYFRWKYPDRERPYKVAMVIPYIFVVVSLSVVVWSIYVAPLDFAYGIGVTLLALPVWLIFVWWRNKPLWVKSAVDSFTTVAQHAMYVSPADEDGYEENDRK